VQLFEEFDPGKAKAKIKESAKKVQDRMKGRKEAIAKATKAEDATRVDINKTKLDIDGLDLQKLKLKSNIVDMKAKKQKEKQAKA
jgi:hypothetical protein